MTFTESFLQELERESATTRKMLALVPEDKFDWKPHEKSMNLKQLATHVAEIPGWLNNVINADGLDFGAMEYKPHPISSSAELMDYFEKNLAGGKENLQKTNDETLINKTWSMRTGDKIHMTDSKLNVVRHCFCQVVHHRAQLGVYLRLLNIPIPGSYGPSADDNNF